MKLKEGIPRHTQITNWLKTQIKNNVFKPEEKLPSENELSEKFDVSRVTVRRALQSLESESIIYRCQGLGSFVSGERAPHHLIKLTDFNEDMAKAGLEASSVVNTFEMTDAPEWLCHRLMLEPGSKVLQIDRLRLGNRQPVAFDTTWLPAIYGQLLHQNKLADHTIYSILENDYNIPVTKGCYQLSAKPASPQLSKELRVDVNTPLFLIERISYTIGEKPLYYQKRYYRSDKVVYKMTLERAGDEPVANMPLKEFIPVFSDADK